MRRSRWSLLAAATALALTGCPGGDGGGASSGGTASGGSSPKDAFEEFEQASSSRDFGTFYDCVNPAEHDTMAVGAIMAAGFAAKTEDQKKALKALREKHKVGQAKSLLDMDKLATELLGPVTDKRALFVDLMTLTMKWIDEKPKRARTLKGEIKITGDTASGLALQVDEHGATKEATVFFVQVEGNWYVALEDPDKKRKEEAEKREQQEKRRKELEGKVSELRTRLDQDPGVAKQLEAFAVERSRFKSGKGGFDQASINLDVANGTGKAVARAFFSATLATPGRDVPWVHDSFNYSIPGGLEPGEKASWSLAPNMFGAWSKAPKDRLDMVFTVEVVRLEDADGNPVTPGRFTEDDAETLERLAGDLGDEQVAEAIAASLSAWRNRLASGLDRLQAKQMKGEIDELGLRVTDAEATQAIRDRFVIVNSTHYKPKSRFGAIGRTVEVTVKNGTPKAVTAAVVDVTFASPGRAVPWFEGKAYFFFRGGLEPGEEAVVTHNLEKAFQVPFDERQDIKMDLRLHDLRQGDDVIFGPEVSETDLKRLASLRELSSSQ